MSEKSFTVLLKARNLYSSEGTFKFSSELRVHDENSTCKSIGVDLATALAAVGIPRVLSVLAHAIVHECDMHGMDQCDYAIYNAAVELRKHWEEHDIQMSGKII